MPNQELLKAIQELQRSKPFLRQTMIYANIDEESLNLVKNDFPEFNRAEEIPLVFCKGYSQPWESRWIFISTKRFYYRVAFYPPVLTALDSIALQKIQSLKLSTWWVLNYIKLNEKTLGTIIISSIMEILFLRKVIKVILNNVDSNELEIIDDVPVLNYYPPIDWQHLNNASLFTLVNDYFSEHNHGGRLWGFCDLYTHPFIKPEKMDLARQEYADFDSEEEVPLLFIENGGNRASGIVITNKCLYYNLKPSLFKTAEKGKLALDRLTSFRVKSRIWGWIYVNNRKKGMTNAFDILERKAARVFEKLVTLIIENVPDNDDISIDLEPKHMSRNSINPFSNSILGCGIAIGLPIVFLLIIAFLIKFFN